MARAAWNGATIAESDDVVVVEGNVYFPIQEVDNSLLEHSPRTSRCFWKGKASYYDIVVDGERLPAGAFTYERPWPLARMIRNRIAFWQSVQITR